MAQGAERCAGLGHRRTDAPKQNSGAFAGSRPDTRQSPAGAHRGDRRCGAVDRTPAGRFSIPLSPDQYNLRLILFNLGAIAVVIAAHRRQSFAGRRLALMGAIPALLANAVYLVTIMRIVAQPGEIGPGDYGPIFLYGAAAMWLSDLWFGVVTFKLGVLSRWSAAALVVGSFAAFAGMGVFGLQAPGSIAEKIILAGIALHGLAWVLLGLEVALRRRPAAVEQT